MTSEAPAITERLLRTNPNVVFLNHSENATFDVGGFNVPRYHLNFFVTRFRFSNQAPSSGKVQQD